MEMIREELTTKVGGRYDVIVVGAGPAGCGAAIGAARRGARTLLIDEHTALGGMWTMGFINPLFDAENKDGFVRELIDALDECGQWGGFRHISFHYEYMKRILDEKMEKAGVSLCLATRFVRALTEGRTVTGVVTENADGRRAYFARTVIDCTGDANVAAAAGCSFAIGDDGGDIAECQAMTLMFLIGNLPDRYAQDPEGLMVGDILAELYQRAGKTTPFMKPVIIPIPHSHFAVVQFTHMYAYDPLSAASRAAAAAEGRRQMIEAFELLKGGYEDFRDIDLICSAPMLGIRESRRIVGEYTLSAADLYGGQRPIADPACTVAFNVDIHDRGSGNAQQLREVTPYSIPVRAMIPHGYEGLLVAGRCISGTHEAMASYRVTADCCRMGQTAGAVAAYSARTGTPLREVSVKKALG